MNRVSAIVVAMLLVSAAVGQETGTFATAPKSGVQAPTEAKTKPKPPQPSAGKQAGKRDTPARKVELNPQPLPPGAKSPLPGSKVALNPQPLPPGTKNTSPASKVELNPQPLPPGAKAHSLESKQAKAASGKKGTVPAKAGAGSQK